MSDRRWRDGSEDRIAGILRAATDRSSGSDELAAHIDDWPTRYHLDRRRTNLLRPLLVGSGMRVLDVGAGTGVNSRFLAEAGADVVAVEIDDVLVGVLAEVTGEYPPERLRIVHSDAMAVDWDDLLGDGPWALVANLPYNISVPLVCDLLDAVPAIHRMVVMVQREVGERLVAAPGDDPYGLPSLKVRQPENIDDMIDCRDMISSRTAA